MAMKLRVKRPFRNGNMIYDIGAIIHPTAIVGELYIADGSCELIGDEIETASAPTPEEPAKRKRRTRRIQWENNNVDNDRTNNVSNSTD